MQWTIKYLVIAVLLSMHLPIQAQFPTLSDVDQGSETASLGPIPDWDVAVVKPHPPQDGTMSWQMTADGLSLSNLSLEQMICNAWEIKSYEVSGLTGWMKHNGYDLTAKVSVEDAVAYEKLSVAQRREMLQKLLTERFQLKIHKETKTLPLYDLATGKNGSKLTVSTAIAAPSKEEMQANPDKYKQGEMTMGPGLLSAKGVQMRSLTNQLSNVLGKPVHDATGLKGRYDIELHFRPGDQSPDSSVNSEKPSVFSAIDEQLGLKLIPNKGPVVTLVVDVAEKPGPN